MFSKILIATDSSPSSWAVIDYAKTLYPLGAKEVVLAQCFSIREHVAFPDQIKTYVEGSLRQQKRSLEKQGFRTTVIAEPGLPGSRIPLIAQEQNCSLIIVGSHGHNLTGEIFLGGTVTEIIHQATKPILIIHLKVDEETGGAVHMRKDKDLMHHILYATDFSDCSVKAFDYVSQFVKRSALHVTLLHVQDKTRLSTHLVGRLDEFNEIDRKRLELLEEHLKAIGNAHIDVEIPYGLPIDEILKRVKTGDASVVVIGSHGRGFINELFLGSVSHNVARHCEVPVLLIPGKN
ncbi:MAG: universal stress protein [Pirellulales bacterium]|nr:universal stress protein [Pirellulales bacterium]